MRRVGNASKQQPIGAVDPLVLLANSIIEVGGSCALTACMHKLIALAYPLARVRNCRMEASCQPVLLPPPLHSCQLRHSLLQMR
jgi:hypothetical protein